MKIISIPVITKPTRITDHTKTLIDHIYTNTPIDQVVSGIGLFDISDHLPVFCILRMSIKREYYKRFYRDYKHFSEDEYLHDLMHTNWNNKLNNLNDSLNQVTKDVIDTIRELTDKHAPIKEVPRSKAKQFSKPWITSGILKSIKTKQKMYRSHFFSNDIEKVTIYKKYSNKLNKIKSTSKVNYYNAQFEKM